MTRFLRGLGFGLLAAWIGYWVLSILHDRAAFAWALAFGAGDALGLDFMHSYFAVRFIAGGGNPYLQAFGDARGLYAYPPIVLMLHAWCALPGLSLRVTAALWALGIGAIVTAATLAVLQWRRRWDLTEIPRPFALALALWSLPVVFAMERGGVDAWVLVFAMIGASLLNRSVKRSHDAGAGLVLGAAAWIKLLPVGMLLAPLALKRRRVLAWALVSCLCIAGCLLPATREWMSTFRAAHRGRSIALHETARWLRDPGNITYLPVNEPAQLCTHNIGGIWPRFWLMVGLEPVARFPGLIVAGLVVAGLSLAMVMDLFRRGANPAMALPLLLWFHALFTFGMPESYDYNLLGLPIVMLAVWDRRDPWPIHLAFAFALLGFLPFLPVSEEWILPVFAAKMSGLLVAGVCLVRRASSPTSDGRIIFGHTP